ncbi:MAG: hypothetical protein Kow00102_14200 [Spirochaetota bacterium]|nr:hypothetical protein [Spirochaetota bacterium]
MRKLKIISWILSCIVSFLAGFYFNNINPKSEPKMLVKQIQGEKIQHSNINFQGKYISFNTASEGKGKIYTQIPKEIIPEAYSWLYKNHCIQAGLFYQYHNQLLRSFSLAYFYRYQTVSFGAGPIFGDTIGFNIFFQYWFSAK